MRKRGLLVLLVGLVCLGTVLSAQESGQVTGVVSDPSKAVVPGAKVTVTSVGTQATRTTSTNTEGIFVVTSLQPGIYEISVEAKGFARSIKRAEVTVGSKVGVDFTLEVGKEVTVVEVIGAGGVQVNTESQTMSQVISTKQVMELPTLTRNPYALVVTSGNVSEDSPDGRGAGFSINGARSASTNILLDGVPNNDEFGATVGQNVPLDSVQEFSLLTNNFGAEFGRASGGVVNVATKSGTNDFHGTAYEFNRVSRLASNSFNNNANLLPKSVFDRNQFGYSIGGPVIKNKLFFFENTEWTRVRSGSFVTAWVPDPAYIAASSAATKAFFQPYKLRSSITPLGTFSRTQLTSAGYDPCKGSGSTGNCNGYSTSAPMWDKVAYGVPSDSGAGSPQNSYSLVGRVDYNKSEKTQIYVRYALENDNLFSGTVNNSPWDGFDTGQTQVNNSFLVSLTRTFNPTTVLQSKISFNRFNNQQPLGATTVVPTLYMNATAGVGGNNFLGYDVAMPGYSAFSPGNAIPFGGPQNFLQLDEDASKTIGKHQIRFGGHYTYIHDNRTFGAYEEAVMALGNNVGVAMDNLSKGQLRLFEGAINPQGKYPGNTVTLPVGPPNFSRSNRYHEFAFYAQDSWKIRPRLTLNLGLRWEYFGIQHNKDASLDSNFYDGTGGNIFQQIRAGKIMPATSSPVGGLWAKDWKDYAPRVGFAWDIFGDGKTSFRGGYGIGYERNFGNVTFNMMFNPPNYAVVSLTAGVDVPTIPMTLSNAGPLAGSSGSKVLPGVSLRNVNSNIKTAYAHLASASLEHEFHKNILMALEYSGSFGERLYTIENVNRTGGGNVFLGDPCGGSSGPGDPGTCTSKLVPTTYASAINRRGFSGLSNYNSMNVRTDIRNVANSGVNMRINYTWSHAIDNLSDTFSSSGNDYNLGLLDPFNPQLDRGSAQFDNRHRLAMSGTWDVPFARNVKGPARYFLHGWSLAPIWTARTGAPYTLWDDTNGFGASARAITTGAFSSVQRTASSFTPTSQPNQFVLISLPQSAFNSNWVNPITHTSDFGPFPGSMLPRGFMRGTGSWNLDMGIYKTTKITERWSVQLRGEMYNMFNHANVVTDTADADVANGDGKTVPIFGSKQGRRDVQLAIKIIF